MENPSEIIRSFDRTEPIPTQAARQEHQPVQPTRKPPRRVAEVEPLLTAEDVAKRLNVSTDWVWDHSSRKKPLLPVIRMGDGALRYRASGIEAFIDERERLGALRRRA
jgi:predicted DNA-binding transcriptional regulator AlpA